MKKAVATKRDGLFRPIFFGALLCVGAVTFSAMSAAGGEDVGGASRGGRERRKPSVFPLPAPSKSTVLNITPARITPRINLVDRGIKLPAEPKVMLVPLNKETTRWNMIDAWQAAFIGRRLAWAERGGFDLVVLKINTPGGVVASCEEINRRIAACKVPVIVFIQGKAFSGGALVSLGCKAIVMDPISQIGGAQAVGLWGDLPADQREKARVYLTAMVKALARQNGYPVDLVLGMVDQNPAIYETDAKEPHRFITDTRLADWKRNPAAFGGVPPPKILKTWKKNDELLDLTASEAYDAGVACGIVRNRDELFAALGVQPATVVDADLTSSERAARFLSHPVWRILLVIASLVALFWEMKTPGHGIGYGLFGFGIGLFFWLQFFAGNAGWLEIVLFGVGAVLLAAEFFFIPGFGFPGFAGFACVLFAIIFAFLPEGGAGFWSGSASPWEQARMTQGALYGGLAVTGALVVMAAALIFGVRLPGLDRLALSAKISSGAEATFAAAGEARRRIAVPAATGRDAEKGTGQASPVSAPDGKKVGGSSLSASEIRRREYEALRREQAEYEERRRREREETLAREEERETAAREALWSARPSQTGKMGKRRAELHELVGKEGKAETTLRPSGRVRLEGRSYDARTEGEFLDKGVRVRVFRVESAGLVVREV